MEFQQLFADQFKAVAENKYGSATTRSSKLLEPIHSKIAELVEKEGFSTRSLCNSEYEFIGAYGSKKLILPFLMVINSQELSTLREFALNIIKMQIIIMKI